MIFAKGNFPSVLYAVYVKKIFYFLKHIDNFKEIYVCLSSLLITLFNNGIKYFNFDFFVFEILYYFQRNRGKKFVMVVTYNCLI